MADLSDNAAQAGDQVPLVQNQVSHDGGAGNLAGANQSAEQELLQLQLEKARLEVEKERLALEERQTKLQSVMAGLLNHRITVYRQTYKTMSDSDSDVSARVYVSNLGAYLATTCDKATPRDKVLIFAAGLTGEAQRWYGDLSSTPNGQAMTLVDWTAALLAMFESKRTPQQENDQLRAMRQVKGQSIQDFHLLFQRQFLKASATAPLSDADLRHIFINCLYREEERNTPVSPVDTCPRYKLWSLNSPRTRRSL